MAVVNGTKRKKSSFFLITKTSLSRGWLFLTGDRPSEQAYRDKAESIPYFANYEDRAKEEAAGKQLADLQGLTIAANDKQVVDGQEKSEFKTWAVQPSQVTQVQSGSEETIGSGILGDLTPFTGTPISVEKDAEVSTHRSYVAKVSEGFSTWLGKILDNLVSLQGTVSEAVRNIATNTSNILSNSQAIAALAGAEINGLTPVGTVVTTMGNAAPTGWMLLAGDIELSTTTYADLYAIMGDRVGDSIGKTPTGGNFILWDSTFNGTVPGAVGGSNTQFGTTGTEFTDITNEQIPDHTHTSGNYRTSTDGEHSHVISIKAADGTTPKSHVKESNNGSPRDAEDIAHAKPAGFHDHDIINNSGGIKDRGASQALSLMQPTMFMQYMIYTGV